MLFYTLFPGWFTPDADIDAPEAWQMTTGSDEVIVGVIDSGAYYEHEDLSENMWVNPNEIPGNGVDDDANGYIDDIYGIDATNDDTDPMDDMGHGTHCAGTIGAVGNNEIGVVGVNWNVKIMALKCVDADDCGFKISAAIESLSKYLRKNSGAIDQNRRALQESHCIDQRKKGGVGAF